MLEVMRGPRGSQHVSAQVNVLTGMAEMVTRSLEKDWIAKQRRESAKLLLAVDLKVPAGGCRARLCLLAYPAHRLGRWSHCNMSLETLVPCGTCRSAASTRSVAHLTVSTHLMHNSLAQHAAVRSQFALSSRRAKLRQSHVTRM